MVKPMDFNFWPDELMESHKVLEGMMNDDDDNQGQTNNEWERV